MAANTHKPRILAILDQSGDALSLPELLTKIDFAVPERTLRRWLSIWVDENLLARTGNRRSTRYRLATAAPVPELGFLTGLSPSRKTALIGQLRDLWTHSSTAVEGNTLTLGDTHFVLEQGLTISGKPLKDHQEVIGHARAIEILYRNLNNPIAEASIFDLHRAVQTEVITDIYKPNGAWKLEANGTYVVTQDNQQVYIEYADPSDVPHLMQEIITELNIDQQPSLILKTAHKTYAKIHAGIAHTHPFWDGNGRMARLLANIPLLRAGLPPIVIPNEQRMSYIQLLAEYELQTGRINKDTGLWPNINLLLNFENFCAECYATTTKLIEDANCNF